eukprot:g8550.t1
MASRLSPALFALLVFLGVYLTVVAANGATRRKKKIHHKKSSGTTDLDKLETETMPLHQAQMLDSRAKLGASRLAATFLKRARVTEMRATKLMRKPFPPGMSQLGNGFNAFNGKVTQGVISINPELVHDGSQSPLYEKYNVPAAVYGDLLHEAGDEKSTVFYQEEQKLRQEMAHDMGLKNSEGFFTMFDEVQKYRPTFASNDYVVEVQKSMKEFEIGLNLDEYHAKEGIKLDTKRLNERESVDFEPDVRPKLLYNYKISPLLKRAVIEELPDCVFNPRSLVLDRDRQEDGVEQLYLPRMPAEEKHSGIAGEKVRMCNAEDTWKVAKFYHTFGTHFIDKVTLGGKAKQTFIVRGAAVDTEDIQTASFVSSLINKYNEHVGVHKNTGGKYDRDSPLITEIADAFSAKGKAISKSAGSTLFKANRASQERSETAQKIQSGNFPNPVQDEAKELESSRKQQGKPRRSLLASEEPAATPSKTFKKSFDHGLNAAPNPSDIESFLHSLGIQKVTMEYIGGGRFPIDGTNLMEDDYEVWEESTRLSPDVINSDLSPLYSLFKLKDFVVTNTVKRTAADIMLKNKKVSKVKALRRATKQWAGRKIFSFSYGRQLIRKEILMKNYLTYFRNKAHKYAFLMAKKENLLFQVQMHLNRMKKSISHYGNAILKLDPQAHQMAGNFIGTMNVWNKYISGLLDTNPKAASLMGDLVGPLVQYSSEIYHTRRLAASYCQLSAETFSRGLRLNGYGNLDSIKKNHHSMSEKKVLARANSTSSSEDAVPVDEIGQVPVLEEKEPLTEMRARNVEGQCNRRWKNKLTFHEKNYYAENSEFGSTIKKLFFEARDLSCMQCVSIVHNELDPQRDFTGSKEVAEEGIQSSVLAYCYSLPTKYLQTSCKITARSLRDTIAGESVFAPHDALDAKKQLSWFLEKLFARSSRFRVYSKPIDQFTGKETDRLETSNKVCGLYQGCEWLFNDDHEEIKGEKSLTDANEAMGGEEEAEKALVKESEKITSQKANGAPPDTKKLKKLQGKFSDAVKAKTCSDFRLMYHQYNLMKQKVATSKSLKNCFVCSRFILLNRFASGSQGGMMKGESLSEYPKQYLKYPDYSKNVCVGEMFSKSNSDSLKVAEGSCPNGFKKFIGKKRLSSKKGGRAKVFLELVAAATAHAGDRQSNPLSDMLSDSGAAAKADPLGMKRMGKSLNNAKLDCGVGKVSAKDTVKLQNHIDCIMEKTNGMFKSDMSKSQCNRIVKGVKTKVMMKLKYLAASLGRPLPGTNMPFPKQVQLYDELRDLAVNANGEATESVIDGGALGSAGLLTYNSLCCDLKMCSYKNANFVRSYFSKQAAGNWHYAGLMKESELEGPFTEKTVPLARPGFGELGPTEVKSFESANVEFKKLTQTDTLAASGTDKGSATKSKTK